MNLHQAIKEGNTDEVINLINESADIEDTNEDGTTPLYLAAYQGYTDIVELLLDRGADIEATDNGGQTPLHLALENRGTTKALLKRGANIDATNKKQETPLHLAIYTSSEFFTNEGRSFYIYTDREGHTDIYKYRDRLVDLLLNEGSSINAVDINEDTPLHLSAKEGEINIIDILVKNGANIHIVNKIEETPIMCLMENIDYNFNKDRHWCYRIILPNFERQYTKKRLLNRVLSLIDADGLKFTELRIDHYGHVSTIEYLKKQYEIATAVNTRKLGCIEKIQDRVKTKAQKQAKNIIRESNRALFNM